MDNKNVYVRPDLAARDKVSQDVIASREAVDKVRVVPQYQPSLTSDERLSALEQRVANLTAGLDQRLAAIESKLIAVPEPLTDRS